MKSLPLLEKIQERFHTHFHRHPNVLWKDVEDRLLSSKTNLAALEYMELSGGEPDVVLLPMRNASLIICDCAVESPAGRRSLCFDEAALASRKENKPKGSAEGFCLHYGLHLMDEHQYLALQKLQPMDLKTSSWLATPMDFRKAGGALFGDNRFGRAFIYHNGAASYYAARGFRAFIPLS